MKRYNISMRIVTVSQVYEVGLTQGSRKEIKDMLQSFLKRIDQFG